MYSLDLSILSDCKWIELVCFHEWQLKGFVFRRWFHYMFFHTLDSCSQKSGLRAHRALKDTLRGNCFDSATNMSPSNVSFIRLCHQQSHRQWLEALSAGMRTTEIRSFEIPLTCGLNFVLRYIPYFTTFTERLCPISQVYGYSLALHFVAQQVLLCGCVVRMVWNHFIHMCGSKFVTCTCRNTETRCTLVADVVLETCCRWLPKNLLVPAISVVKRRDGYSFWWWRYRRYDAWFQVILILKSQESEYTWKFQKGHDEAACMKLYGLYCIQTSNEHKQIHGSSWPKQQSSKPNSWAKNTKTSFRRLWYQPRRMPLYRRREIPMLSGIFQFWRTSIEAEIWERRRTYHITMWLHATTATWSFWTWTDMSYEYELKPDEQHV